MKSRRVHLLFLGTLLDVVFIVTPMFVDYQAVEEESESDSDDISVSSVSDSSDEEVRPTY